MATLEEALREESRVCRKACGFTSSGQPARRIGWRRCTASMRPRCGRRSLGHDLVRATPPDELLRLAEKIGMEPNEAERAAPVLLHGAIAARLLAERFGVDDAEVLAAVRYHTTGRAGMSDVEKVVFLADKTEPDELAYYPEWREVHDLAQRDLDAAMLRALELYLERARREGWTVHPDVIAARDDLLSRRTTHPQ